MTTVDPFNTNQAILADGTLGFAFWLVPEGAIADPNRPTVAELNALKSETPLGYGNFTVEEAPEAP